MESRPDELTKHIEQLTTRLSKVRRERIELDLEEQRIGDELIKARKVLQSWRRENGISEPLEPVPAFVFEQHRHIWPKKPRARNPGRLIVVDAVCEIIKKAGHALSAVELYDGLVARGIEIQGRKPEVVLTTMLWRSQDRLVCLSRGSYWLKGLPDPSLACTDIETEISPILPREPTPLLNVDVG